MDRDDEQASEVDQALVEAAVGGVSRGVGRLNSRNWKVKIFRGKGG